MPTPNPHTPAPNADELKQTPTSPNPHAHTRRRRLIFLSSHFAAHLEKLDERNADYAKARAGSLLLMASPLASPHDGQRCPLQCMHHGAWRLHSGKAPLALHRSCTACLRFEDTPATQPHTDCALPAL